MYFLYVYLLPLSLGEMTFVKGQLVHDEPAALTGAAGQGMAAVNHS
jgi:hypothetical protein